MVLKIDAAEAAALPKAGANPGALSVNPADLGPAPSDRASCRRHLGPALRQGLSGAARSLMAFGLGLRRCGGLS